MQGKGFIRAIAILLLLVSIYQLVFTWKANQIEKKAESEAKEYVSTLNLDGDAKYVKMKKYEQDYLDSLYEEPVFLNFFTYKQVKKAALKLGLDLQGGMSVVLEADIKNLLENLADNSKNESFTNALNAAKREQQSTQGDFIDLFVKNFQGSEEELLGLFRNADTDEYIGDGASKADLKNFLKKEADDAFASTYDIIQSRIDQFGLLQPSIQRQDASKRIMIEIPGVDNPARVRNLLQSTANLEFFEVYTSSEFFKYLDQANKALKEKLDLENPTQDEIALVDQQDENNTADASSENNELDDLLGDAEKTDEAKAIDDEKAKAEFKKNNPLFNYLQPNFTQGVVIGYATKNNVDKINEYLALPEVQAVFPSNAKIMWEAKPIVSEDENGKKSKIYSLLALKGDQDGLPLLDGSAIKSAFQSTDQAGKVVVSMQMNQQGAASWYDITQKNVGKPVAIALDNKVYSYPNINEPIAGGSSQISGNFTLQEAQDLSTVLKTGKLDVPAQIIEEEVVGPTIGGESARAGLISLLAGLVLVLLFMIIYYGKAGIIADVALLFNLLLVIGVLAARGATLTLPGIAGLVLTIGMAVDANVIIFERVREELAKGFSLAESVAKGYQASYSAIIDANITTLIIAIILGVFGVGPVKGFGIVLMIGIFTSFFTGVLFTRLIKDDMLIKGKTISYWTSLSKSWFQNLNFDFISKRKFAYILSGIIVLASLGNLVTRGGEAFDLGVDLSSGRSYTVRFDQAANANEVKTQLDAAFPNASNLVRTFGKDEQLKITTTYLTDQAGIEIDEKAQLDLFNALKGNFNNVDFDQFKSDYLQSSQKVDSSIADDLRRQSTWLTLTALFLIFIYLLIRFRKWQFGLAAVITLAHDSLVILAVFSFLRGVLPFALEVDQAFIAALLTIIGYSINDTVIVFDRIREELKLNPKDDYKQVINQALNSTLSRTVITSLTTLIVVLLLFVFGGEVIRGFAFALLIGIIVGTYSSLFVATPIVTDLYKQEEIDIEEVEA